MLIRRSKLRKCAGLVHGLAQCRRTKVGGTCVALSLALEYRDANTPVIRIFQALYITQACGRTETKIVTRRSLGLVDAALAGFLKHKQNKIFEFLSVQRDPVRQSIHVSFISIVWLFTANEVEISVLPCHTSITA